MDVMMEGLNVKKVYDTGQLKVTAIQNVNLKINKGELVVILGQSGAGKSTLLNLIGGMDYVTEGSLIMDKILFKLTKSSVKDNKVTVRFWIVTLTLLPFLS